MCNRAGGLICRVIESHGIPTASLSVNRGMTEKVPAPRNAHLNFPYGATMGEPGKPGQHLTILRDLLEVARTASTPGVIFDLPHKWRRMGDASPPWESFPD